jgi:hypothetical protein
MLNVPPSRSPPPGSGPGLIMSAFIYENCVSDGPQPSSPAFIWSTSSVARRRELHCRAGRIGWPARADLARPRWPCTRPTGLAADGRTPECTGSCSWCWACAPGKPVPPPGWKMKANLTIGRADSLHLR